VHTELQNITDISLERRVATAICHLILLQWILGEKCCYFPLYSYRKSVPFFVTTDSILSPLLCRRNKAIFWSPFLS